MIDPARIIVTDCTNPHRNLAVEDYLLHNLGSSEAILFLWQNQHTVVIGAGQNAWRECNTALLEREGGVLARRSSGGGAVYHDLGNLNFSFIMPKQDYDVHRQLRVVQQAARIHGIDAELSGRNDLTADGRKFSGNAFRLLKDSALHHGTVLVDVDMAMLGRYLTVDPNKLTAKGVKSVPARVINLNELGSVTIGSIRDALIRAFGEEYAEAGVEQLEQMGNMDGLSELIAKYESFDHNYGRSPVGTVGFYERFGWGAVELSLVVEGGKVTGCQVFTDAMDELLHEKIAGAITGSEFRGVELARRVRVLGLSDLAEAVEREL